MTCSKMLVGRFEAAIALFKAEKVRVNHLWLRSIASLNSVRFESGTHNDENEPCVLHEFPRHP